MLESLRPFINRTPTSQRISMPNLASYHRNLDAGVERLIERNSSSISDPIPSVGIDYINGLIIRADIFYLLQYPNDMERLSRIYREYRANYSDFIRQHPVKEKAFIYSEVMDTVEYLLITDDFNVIEEMPIGSNDIQKWMTEVKPLRMLSNDSLEIQLDDTTSRLRYRYEPPLEAVFSINIIKLLMLYTKYRLTYRDEFEIYGSNYPFIYQSCILPLLKDNIKTWITKIVHDMVMGHLNNPTYQFDRREIIHGEKSNFINSGMISAIHEIDNIISKCADGRVKPDEVLVSLKTSDDTSLFDDINLLMENHYIGKGGNQYQWTEFVREYYLLTIMIGLHRLQPDTSRAKELRKLFEIVSRRLGNTKFWAHSKNPFIADGVKSKFENLVKIFDI